MKYVKPLAASTLMLAALAAPKATGVLATVTGRWPMPCCLSARARPRDEAESRKERHQHGQEQGRHQAATHQRP